MKWMLVLVFVLLTSCLTAGVPAPEYVPHVAYSSNRCDDKCEREHSECMTNRSQFWEQCEAEYDQCIEYCY
jgi:hypothetical protein